MKNVGSRVVAISHSDNDAVYIFGFGVYEGDFPRPGTGIEKEIVETRKMCEREAADPKSLHHH